MSTGRERQREPGPDRRRLRRVGEGTVFDLLADDVVWTITGTSPLAGTYRGREFLTVP